MEALRKAWAPEWADWVPESTLETLRADYMPVMPPLAGGSYLVGYLLEIGPTLAAGGYPGPITHEELRAWQANTGIELQPWEIRFLQRLSNEYLSESHKAEKRDCPAPWLAEDGKPEVTDTQAAIRALAHL